MKGTFLILNIYALSQFTMFILAFVYNFGIFQMILPTIILISSATLLLFAKIITIKLKQKRLYKKYKKIYKN